MTTTTRAKSPIRSSPRSKALGAKSPAASSPLKPITPKQAADPTARKQAIAAHAFMQELSPEKSFGWRYPLEDFDKLPKAAREVLNVFGRGSVLVSKLAGEYGVAPEQKMTPGNELHPRDILRELDSVLAPHKKSGADAASILAKAAQSRSLSQPTREMLNATAALWAGRETSKGWKAATSLRPVEAPPPAPLSSEAKELNNARRRAEQEWNLAPFARGWDHYPERRELVKGTGDSRYEDDIRAFTRDEWMAWRPQQILQHDKHQVERARDEFGRR